MRAPRSISPVRPSFPFWRCSRDFGSYAASMPELRTIAQDDDGIRVDRWFKRHYPALTHGRLEKLLRTGQVRLDGKRVKAADRVAAGQTVRLPPQVVHGDLTEKPAHAKPPERVSGSLQDHIIYMDKNVIVLNKPSGLATQGG